MISGRLFYLLVRWLSIGAAFLLTWWGAWQLPWVQKSAASWVVSRAEGAGISCRLDRISFDWKGRWIFNDFEAELSGHSLEGRELKFRFGIGSIIELSQGRWSVGSTEISGLHIDGSSLGFLDGLSLSGWIEPRNTQWHAEIRENAGVSLLVDFEHSPDQSWQLEAFVEYQDRPIIAAGNSYTTNPSAHIQAHGKDSQWVAHGTAKAEYWPMSSSDALEGDLCVSLEGNHGAWKGVVAGRGLWDREGTVGEATLKADLRGCLDGYFVENAQLVLPFAEVTGECGFGAEWRGAWTLHTNELASWSLLREHWIGPGIPLLKGRAEFELDWLGAPDDCCIGVKASCGKVQIAGYQVEQFKGKIRGVLKDGNWNDFWWSCAGKGQAVNASWKGSKMDQIAVRWQPTESGLQGSLSGTGLCGGRLQLTTDWSLDAENLMLSELSGTLFGQHLSSEEPILLKAKGSSWSQATGIIIPNLDCSWGAGSLRGWAELSEDRWKGRFRALHSPLEWVGIWVGPLECTGFGDLVLTLGGDAQQLRWHGELSSEEATAVLGPITGNCTTLLTLDGTENELDIRGRVRILEARLGLGPLGGDALPSFDLNWTGSGISRKGAADFTVRYGIDLETSATATCSIGPVDTGWQGGLYLSGVNGNPKLSGQLHLQSTDIDLMGFPIHLQGGTIAVAGCSPEEIQLDLRGETKLLEGSAFLACTGSADEPCISVSSDAGWTTSQLFEQLARVAEHREEPETANRLRQALQWLPKADPDAMMRMRKESGLDKIELATPVQDQEILQLVLGRQLTERLLVQLHQNLGADVSGFSIESGESFSTVQGRSYALQSGTTLLPPGRFALRWKMHY